MNCTTEDSVQKDGVLRIDVKPGQKYSVDCETSGANGAGPATILVIKK